MSDEYPVSADDALFVFGDYNFRLDVKSIIEVRKQPNFFIDAFFLILLTLLLLFCFLCGLSYYLFYGLLFSDVAIEAWFILLACLSFVCWISMLGTIIACLGLDWEKWFLTFDHLPNLHVVMQVFIKPLSRTCVNWDYHIFIGQKEDSFENDSFFSHHFALLILQQID